MYACMLVAWMGVTCISPKLNNMYQPQFECICLYHPHIECINLYQPLTYLQNVSVWMFQHVSVSDWIVCICISLFCISLYLYKIDNVSAPSVHVFVPVFSPVLQPISACSKKVCICRINSKACRDQLRGKTISNNLTKNISNITLPI